MTRRPLALGAYRLLSRPAEPVVRLWLQHRQKHGKEDERRLDERFGHASRERPGGPLIWVHAASVGETNSVLALIGRLVVRAAVLLTTGTVTSAQLAAEKLPAGAIHQYLPVDSAGAVARFLAHWRPDLAILTESELWPNLMGACFERDIPLGIVNGRISARSFARWRRVPGIAAALLSPLAFCLAQSEADAARFAGLGAPAASPGNLKFDASPLGADAGELARLRAEIGDRPVLVAASTHPGEEAMLLDALAPLLPAVPDLLTILVPRHPQRGEEIAALAAAAGLPAGRRSQGARPGRAEPLHIADTLGELGLFYRLATLAFIGGSLVPRGGHNPIEAIQLGAPVISGPHVANFAGIFAELAADDGLASVAGREAFAATAGRLLADAEARASLAQRARGVIERHQGALERSLLALTPFLPEPG